MSRLTIWLLLIVAMVLRREIMGDITFDALFAGIYCGGMVLIAHWIAGPPLCSDGGRDK